MRALLLLLACGSSATSHPDLSMVSDLMPPRITAAASSGTVTLANADFSISGSGQARFGAFNITHGSGTIEIDGNAVPVAVYERQAFPAQNLHLYQTLAVEPSRIWVMWFYCSTTDNSLQDLFYENTDGTAVSEESSTGTCMDANTTSTVTAQFPAIDMPVPALIDGFTMEGPSVHLAGAMPGSVQLGSSTLTVFVFNTVDCRTNCAPPGWTELHSLLWDPVKGQVCFAIFYLNLDDTAHVQLTYSLTLPTLTDPAGNTLLPATWMTP
jgi:hypothetical protein